MSLVALQHKYHWQDPFALPNVKMKEIAKKIYCFLETMGRIRAASTLARQGRHEMAKAVMMEKSECCC